MLESAAQHVGAADREPLVENARIDAAGHGWFVDPTSTQDEEFSAGTSGALQALPSGPEAGHVDLLTAVFQELGQAAGLTGDLLPAPLTAGVRNVAALDTVFAGAS